MKAVFCMVKITNHYHSINLKGVNAVCHLNMEGFPMYCKRWKTMQQALCKLPGMAKHFKLKIGLSHMQENEQPWDLVEKFFERNHDRQIRKQSRRYFCDVCELWLKVSSHISMTTWHMIQLENTSKLLNRDLLKSFLLLFLAILFHHLLFLKLFCEH